MTKQSVIARYGKWAAYEVHGNFEEGGFAGKYRRIFAPDGPCTGEWVSLGFFPESCHEFFILGTFSDDGNDSEETVKELS